MKPILLFTLISCFTIPKIQAQSDSAEIKALEKKVESLIEKIDKKKKIEFGFSIGYRQAFSIGEADRFLAEASISPFDSTLQIELLNRHSFLVSAVINVNPWIDEKCRWYRRIGFYANINLAEIASDGNFESIFNQQIEGGMGISYRFSEPFAISAGYEFVFHRRIRNYVFEFEGKKLIDSSGVITSLDKNNDELFRSDNVHAWSLKFIYFL